MAIKLTITGENADEVYEQLMNLSKVPDYYYRPWEYDLSGKVKAHNDQAATIEPDALKFEEAKEKDTSKKPEGLNQGNGKKPEQTEPAGTVSETKYITLFDLQTKCKDFGLKHGKQEFSALKAKMGVTSISQDLDDKGRQAFADLIDLRDKELEGGS